MIKCLYATKGCEWTGEISDVKVSVFYTNTQLKSSFTLYIPSKQKPVQSQPNIVRKTFFERYFADFEQVFARWDTANKYTQLFRPGLINYLFIVEILSTYKCAMR